jgi:uncharacterized RmlC-like cupin family protein
MDLQCGLSSTQEVDDEISAKDTSPTTSHPTVASPLGTDFSSIQGADSAVSMATQCIGYVVVWMARVTQTLQEKMSG